MNLFGATIKYITRNSYMAVILDLEAIQLLHELFASFPLVELCVSELTIY